MHSVQAFSLLALAGSAIAAPQGWANWAGKGQWGGQQDQPAATATDVAVVTAYTTVTWGGNWGKPTGTPAAPTNTPVATTAPAPAPAAPSSSWSAWSSSAPAAAAPTGSSSSSGYMGIVNEWRGKMGMSSLTQASNLEANALKTVQDGNGQMVHELNPGSMAQVLAPGQADGFEKVFVGGWLCEKPSLPGLDGICTTMSQGWAYGGETGHADILTSTAYSKIGCALANGIWGCDLA